MTVGLAAVGLVVGVVLFAGGIRDARGTGREATRVPLGQAGLVTFDRPESFTLSYFGTPEVVFRSDVPSLADRIGATLEPVGGGAAVAFDPYGGAGGIQTQRGGAQQVALATFHIDRPGTYTLRSNLIQGVGPNDAELIVSVSPFRALARGAAQAGVVFAVGCALSLIATVALAKTRGRSRRAGYSARPGPGGPVPLVPTTAAGSGPGGPALPPGWYGPPPLVPPPPPGYGPADRST